MSKINFLDINFDHNETDLYYETRHTGQYIDFTSQTLWELKTTWVKELCHKASKMFCCKKDFSITSFYKNLDVYAV